MDDGRCDICGKYDGCLCDEGVRCQHCGRTMECDCSAPDGENMYEFWMCRCGNVEERVPLEVF